MPLQLNLPTTSVRDLVVHEDDLVVGTHGRSFWILDDVTPLRQMTPAVTAAHVHLFAPQAATRVRRSRNTDTPLPPEEPAGENPPDGAILDYWLGREAAGPVTLEILDPQRTVVRRYFERRPAPTGRAGAEDRVVLGPAVRGSSRPSPGSTASSGTSATPTRTAAEHEYPISAIPRDTPRGPAGPLALPGPYTVRLTVDGTALEQPLKLRMDPRIATPPEGLAAQLALARADRGAAREDRRGAEECPRPSGDAQGTARRSSGISRSWTGT